MASYRTVRDLATTVEQLLVTAHNNRHRATLVLTGAPEWARNTALQLSNAFTTPVRYWISNQRLPDVRTIAPHQVDSILGSECDLLIVDALDGLNPDALAGASGTLRSGGLFLLLIPPLQNCVGVIQENDGNSNPVRAGYFLQYLAAMLGTSEVTIRTQSQTRDSTIRGLQIPVSSQTATNSSLACTDDQQAAIHTVRQVVLGQRKKPALLIADRGRGKSAAMGLAAASLLQQGVRHILVTASHYAAVQSLFHHARQRLPALRIAGRTLKLENQHISFMMPDRISQELPATDLLLVDEAASIPVAVLTSWLHHYSRIAFATTVHGYEGSGQGFLLRFERRLHQCSRGVRKVQLQTPIRWAPQDPLEQLVFRLLLLDAEPALIKLPTIIVQRNLKISKYPQQQLSADPDLLRQLFGLLITAHYRTRPSDLRYLLDTPGLKVYLAWYGGQLLGTALVAEEAPEPAELAQAIAEGRRRPPGHLLQQALANHLGLTAAPTLSCRRIVRIAIHPQCQGRGFGSTLLRRIRAEAQIAGIDLIGSSFSASTDMLRFWNRQGLHPVRLGLRRNAASGQHSSLVVLGLSTAGRQLGRNARLRFLDSFEYQLAGPLRTLEPELVMALTQAHHPDASAKTLTSYDRETLQAFCDSGRQLAQCLASIHRAVWNLLGNRDRISNPTPIHYALIQLGLQFQDLHTVTTATGWPNQSVLMEALREELRSCFDLPQLRGDLLR